MLDITIILLTYAGVRLYENTKKAKAKKNQIVGQFKSKGHTVCFVGDGVNDAIAMQQANLSISLRGATTLATDVADIILIEPNLMKLSELLELSQRLENNLKRGLGICYLGMGTVLIGTFVSQLDILTAMGIHFVLGSTAIGNAMLPLLEIKKKPPLLEKSGPNTNLSTEIKETSKPISVDSVSKPAMEPSHPLVIVGAGAAGIASALTAASQGANVVLLEQSGQLGGTVTQTLIHTLGGLFDDQGDFLNAGLPVELTERLTQASPLTKKRRIGKTWTLSVDPQIYAQVVNDWISEYPNIKVRYHTTVTNVSISAKRIDQLTVTSAGKSDFLQPHAVIDTTGRANIVRHVDPGLVTDGIALAGLIIQLRGIAPNAVQFPKGVALLQRIRKAAENQELPPECATLWLDSGVYSDEVYVKFNLIPTDYETSRMTHVAEQLLNFLHTVPDFAQAVIKTRGQLGIRDGGRIQGDYTLTENDIKLGQFFSDAVCQASWPIEHWHPQQGVTLDYFPPGHRYDIPLGALKVSGLDNLFVAGKCFSAEPRAQASARVVGTCWAMGEGLVKALRNNHEIISTF